MHPALTFERPAIPSPLRKVLRHVPDRGEVADVLTCGHRVLRRAGSKSYPYQRCLGCLIETLTGERAANDGPGERHWYECTAVAGEGTYIVGHFGEDAAERAAEFRAEHEAMGHAVTIRMVRS